MQDADPVSLPRRGEPSSNQATRPRRSVPLAATLGMVAASAVGAWLAWRWLDDTTARDQVQVIRSLPQSEGAANATTSAVTSPFGKDGAMASDAATAGAAKAAPTEAPPAAAKAPVAAAARPVPPGVTAEQWQALVAEWSTRADGARERARLEEYLRFTDTVRQFRELNRTSGGDPTPAMVALAKQVDAELDRHVQRQELDSGEAYDIKALALEVLEADPDTADNKLERWAHNLPRSRIDSDLAAMQRDQEFQHRRAVLVQAWSAQAPQARDPKTLERDIQNLQREIYGTAGR